MAGVPTKVLVVEDEAAAARVLIDEVAAAPGFAVAGHTCSGADALRKVVSDDGIDLVLLASVRPATSARPTMLRRSPGCSA
jgi:response regulator of citrate/malate metabolism